MKKIFTILSKFYAQEFYYRYYTSIMRIQKDKEYNMIHFLPDNL